MCSNVWSVNTPVAAAHKPRRKPQTYSTPIKFNTPSFLYLLHPYHTYVTNFTGNPAIASYMCICILSICCVSSLSYRYLPHISTWPQATAIMWELRITSLNCSRRPKKILNTTTARERLPEDRAHIITSTHCLGAGKRAGISDTMASTTHFHCCELPGVNIAVDWQLLATNALHKLPIAYGTVSQNLAPIVASATHVPLQLLLDTPSPLSFRGSVTAQDLT